ncbi:MAG: MFS transporter [Pseudomonadales bacterium]|nr:MFS transporter [Pseudomonadales bacterium]
MAFIARVIVDRYPALGQPSYVKYFLASLAAVGATQLVTFGQLWLVYEITESPIMLGWLGAAAALPNLAITLFGGVISDRYDKRVILLTTSGGNMLLIGLLTVLVLADVVEVWHVLLIAALSSILNGFDWPSRVAIFPQLVDRDQFLSAVALNSFVWQVMRMAIPAPAGFLLYFTGSGVIFGLATGGYLAMCLTMYALQLRPVVSASSEIGAVTQIVEGISFIFRHDIFKYLLALTFIGMFFCNSHDLRDEVGLGLLMTAGGIGSIVGTMVVGGNRHDRNLTNMMLSSGILTAVTTIGFTVASIFAWFSFALVLQFAAAFFASLFLISSMTSMQLSVPDQLRGRVMGIHTMCYSLLPLGGLFLGSLTEFTNVLSAVVSGSGIYVVALVVVFGGFASMRNLRFATLRQIPFEESRSRSQSAGASASMSQDTPVPPKPQ